MKLLPLLGLEDLRFGDPIAKAIVLFGDPDERRSHPDDRCRTSLYFRDKNLTLGFNAVDRLTFIAAMEGAEKIELWGDQPFDVVRQPPDAYESLKQWVERTGRRVQSHQDCFDGNLDIPGEGVSFSFADVEWKHLQGIQLYPE